MKTWRPGPAGWIAAAVWAIAALLAVVVIVRAVAPHAAAHLSRDRVAIAADARADPPLARFYAARGERPLWFDRATPRADASQLLTLIDRAGDDDLATPAYAPAELRAEIDAARGGDANAVARADVALTRALVSYVGDLRRPLPEARTYFPDKALRPPASDAPTILVELSRAASPGAYLAQAHAMNPIYAALRSALAALPPGDAHAAALRLNLERARELPANLGARYVWVNAPAGRLWTYIGDAPQTTMKVVVGKADDQTPVMAAPIRYAMFNPYWNIPPDLVRDRVAPHVLQRGPGYLATQHFEALSGWGPDATVVDPETVDWPAVASGAVKLRVRQRPGPDNMMGRVKFILPNALGVYLHDTPLRGFFNLNQRLASAGCVRLEDATALGRWIFGEDLSQSDSTSPERRVNLIPPVPVYLTYLTAAPTASGVSYLPDIYHRDTALKAAMAKAGRG